MPETIVLAPDAPAYVVLRIDRVAILAVVGVALSVAQAARMAGQHAGHTVDLVQRTDDVWAAPGDPDYEARLREGRRAHGDRPMASRDHPYQAHRVPLVPA